MIRRLAVAAAGLMLLGCGDDPTGPGDLSPVASLAITPIADPLLTRQHVQLAARAFDRQGNELADRPVTWESAEPAVAAVTAGGMLTASAPGSAVLRATTEGIVDSVTVTVRTLQFEHVFAGASQSCGLEAPGNLWCWGRVGSDGYGNGALDETIQDVPTRAATGFVFKSLALSYTSACGIEASGGVVCWGDNSGGQLGDGGTTARGTPAPVAGLGDVAQLVAGAAHFCARTGAGAVSCWGDNAGFQAGEAPRGIVTAPHPITLPAAASDLVAGSAHTCALVAGQSLCWGGDYGGQLGNDTTYDRLVPALAATGDGANRTWSQIDGSNGHTCARDTAGSMYCWGLIEGEGDDNTVEWAPTRRFEGLTATDIAGGWFVQCAVSDQAVASCDGRTFPRVEFTAPAGIAAVAVAGAQACVLQGDGVVGCELGTAQRGALTAVPLSAPAVELVADDNEACALDTAGAVNCWATWDELVPLPVFQSLTVTGVFANSGSRVCVTAQGPKVSCRSSFSGPETVEPIGALTLVTLAVGDNHTCGLTAAGAAWCWGINEHGQLGDGSTTDRAAAVPVQGAHVFTQLTAGYSHTCGLTATGAIYCWGYGSNGSMGDDLRNESAAPVSVDGAPSLVRLGASVGSTCGLDGAGAAWCWPTSAAVFSAGQIGGTAGLVTAGTPCGIGAAGGLLCWGSNFSGWFGDGTFGTSAATAVAGGSGLGFAEVSFGRSGSACGIALDGATYCWGYAFGSSLGSPDANGETATLPLKVYGSP